MGSERPSMFEQALWEEEPEFLSSARLEEEGLKVEPEDLWEDLQFFSSALHPALPPATDQSRQGSVNAKIASGAARSNPWMPSSDEHLHLESLVSAEFVLTDPENLENLTFWLGHDGHKWGLAFCYAARVHDVQLLRKLLELSGLELRQKLEQVRGNLRVRGLMYMPKPERTTRDVVREWLPLITALIIQIFANAKPPDDSELWSSLRKWLIFEKPVLSSYKIEEMMEVFCRMLEIEMFSDDPLSSPGPGFPSIVACLIWYYDIVSVYDPRLEFGAQEFRDQCEERKEVLESNRPAPSTNRRSDLNESIRYEKLLRSLVGWMTIADSPDPSGKTALMIAAESGDLDSVDVLLQSRRVNVEGGLLPVLALANIEAKDYYDKKTALFYAAKSSRMDVVKRLLEAGANIEATDKQGRTALFDAVVARDPEILELLLRSGANINAMDEDGKNLIFYAVAVDVIRKLVLQGLELEKQDHKGRTALFDAVEAATLGRIDMLLESGSNINATDKHGETVLFSAVGAHGDTDIVRRLLEAGVDIETRDRRGRTALSEAIDSDRFEVVRLLLEANASVRSDDLYSLIKHKANVECFNESLHAHGLIRTEVSRTGAQTHLISDNQMVGDLLHYAILTDANWIVEFLISVGVDLEARNRTGETALIAASWGRNTALVKYLVSHGADMEAKDNKRETALHKAVANENVELVKWLVENGANIGAKDSWGNKPSATGDRGLAKWLTQYEQKSYNDLSLQCARDVFQTVRENGTRILTTLANRQCNMLCLAGFDYAASWYNYYNEDDKGFFTGTDPHQALHLTIARKSTDIMAGN